MNQPPAAAAVLVLASGTPAWNDTDWCDLVCRSVLDTTHDVKTFVLDPGESRTFHFEAGQFVTVQAEFDGELVDRCYMIASPPTRPHLLSITVKRVPDGIMSNWLHEHVVPGTRLKVRAPLGHFVLRESPGGKYLFLSAGSGVTPLLSMTRTLYDLASGSDVVFVHSARSPEDIICGLEVESIAAAMPHLRVGFVCASDPAGRWSGLRGRLSSEVLRVLAPDVTDRAVYACGPSGYLDSLGRILAELDYDMSTYHQETFTFADLAAPERAASASTEPMDTRPTTFSVEFVRSGKIIQCAAEQTVLDAALAAGIRHPSSCTQGLCGTCKTTLLEGAVDMRHNGGIGPKEIAQNKILVCCSTPLSDLRLEA